MRTSSMMSDVARRQRCAASGREADVSMLSRSVACPMPARTHQMLCHITKLKKYRATLARRDDAYLQRH